MRDFGDRFSGSLLANLGFWFSGSEHVGFRQPGLWMHENSLNNWKSFNFKWQGGSLEVLKNLISCNIKIYHM
ncbi:unnamed protein product [Rhizophagus irregularis]|nr:unnamed protein product [Rhizophagus irregularis]